MNISQFANLYDLYNKQNKPGEFLIATKVANSRWASTQKTYHLFYNMTIKPLHNWCPSTLQHFAIKFLASRELSPTLHELLHSLNAFWRLNQVIGHAHYSDATDCDESSNLLQCNTRTLVRTFYNVLCTLKSNARFLKIAR